MDSSQPRAQQAAPDRKIEGTVQVQPAAAGPAVTREMVLARFIRLCSSTLASPMEKESAAIIVNRISEIVRVDRAVLVRLSGKEAICAVTGGGNAAQDSSFADAVEYVRRMYRDRLDPIVVPPGQGSSKGPSGHLIDIQNAMGGTSVLWLPLWLNQDAKIPAEYALWLERWHGSAWNGADIELLGHAALFLGHSMARPRRAMVRPKKGMIKAIAALALIVALAWPVTSSVTAPVRVVPDRPYHIFAPMDGILKDLHVMPGDTVRENEILFRYDSRVLDKRLDEARRNVAVARAKLARLQGAAHRDPQARAEVPVQQLEVERAEADVDFYANQLARAEVRTARPGVIVLDDPDALIGAALQTGQAVLSVADPSQTKLRIMVPASDIGFLKEGAQVKVRMDSDPLKSLPAGITRIGFEVVLSQDQIPSVLAEATWVGKTPAPQPGQKGSAKIFGKTTSLGMQILRKPLIAMRKLTGF